MTVTQFVDATSVSQHQIYFSCTNTSTSQITTAPTAATRHTPHIIKPQTQTLDTVYNRVAFRSPSHPPSRNQLTNTTTAYHRVNHVHCCVNYVDLTVIDSLEPLTLEITSKYNLSFHTSRHIKTALILFDNNMVVRLRLQRFGRTHSPFYRMVAADSRAPRDGKFIEIVSCCCPIHSKVLGSD